jgi:hypothetical protein
MQATDSLIEWSGTSRSTVGICERLVQDLAVGLPSSALFGFPFSGFGAAGRTDSRKAPRAICRRATRSQQLSQRPLVRKGDYEAVPIKASDYSLKWIAAKFDQWHSWT